MYKIFSLIVNFYFLTTLLFGQEIQQQKSSDQIPSSGQLATVIVYKIFHPGSQPPLETCNYTDAVTIILGKYIRTTTVTKNGKVETTISLDGHKTVNTIYPNQHLIINASESLSSDRFTRTTQKTGSTKIILNKTCEELSTVCTLAVNGARLETLIFLSNDIDSSDISYYGYKGTPLQMDLDFGGGWIQKWEAVLITKQLIDNNIFKLPPDFETITTREFEERLTSNIKFREEMNKEFQIKPDKTTCLTFKAFLSALFSTAVTAVEADMAKRIGYPTGEPTTSTGH